MDTVKKCPACHKENQLEAAFCAFCAAPLLTMLPARTTEPVPDVPLKIQPPEHIVQLTKLYSDIIVLVVLGQEQPILIKGGGKTTLGRYSPGEVIPSVDLTPYNANLLGISRQHATISRSESGYVLEDIGSTNGTWLNEVKLPPNKPSTLQSGDLIRLGQLGLYVYFDTSPKDKDAETELVLRKENLGDTHFTVQDLSAHLIPYLTALAGIQQLWDSLSDRKTSDISINSFQFDPETTRLKIKLSGAGDAYRLLRMKIIPWQINRVKQAAQLTEAKVLSTSEPSQPIPSAFPGANGHNSVAEEQKQGFEKDELQFMRDLVSEIAPNRSEADKKDFSEKLQSYVHNLTSNPLQFVAND